jgi:D-arabinose 1-dehydrogenase-like Zn-dependent alcohol dehydrogenase
MVRKLALGRAKNLKVQACGVCHSDMFTKEGAWPGIQYPRVPGHEIAGIIDELGAGVSVWEKGQRAYARMMSGHAEFRVVLTM